MECAKRAGVSRTCGFLGNFLLRSESSSKPLTQRFQPCFLIINKPARSGRRRLSSYNLPTKIVSQVDSWRIVFPRLLFPIDKPHKVLLNIHFTLFLFRFQSDFVRNIPYSEAGQAPPVLRRPVVLFFGIWDVEMCHHKNAP